MPEPLYVSNDRKRVGTIASMRAYEAGNDPIESSLEAAILTAVTEETPAPSDEICIFCETILPVILEARETFQQVGGTKHFYREMWQRINDAYLRAMETVADEKQQ